MGHRNYLGKIKKDDFFKPKTYEEYDNIREKTVELHELGKDADYLYKLKASYSVKIKDECIDYNIIEKDDILKIVKILAKKHLAWLKKSKENNENIIDDYIREWKDAECLIYNINKDSNEIVNSWRYEYVLFELLHIYRNFNEQEYHLVYRGY